MTVIRNAAGFLSGAGYDTDDLEAAACQSTTPGDSPATTFSKPWRGTDYEGAKTALFEFVTENPGGVYIQGAVNEVFDNPGASEYRLARRFYERHSQIFKTYSMGSQKWVEPRVDYYEGLNLRQQSIHLKTSGGRRGGDESTDDLEADCGEIEGDGHFPKDRAQSYLENYLMVQSDSVRESLYGAMIDDLEGNEDSWIGFENNLLDRYKWLPYNTRHNNGGKAGKVRDGFEGALRQATERYNSAVAATLTTDSKAHTSLSDALQSLSENKNKLLSWFSTEHQLGYRPEYICVLEFTESGLPHLHLVLFGISYAVSQEQLSAKWGDYGQGWVVHIKEVENVHDGDVWRLHDDGTVVALRDYIGKSIRGLQEVANADAGELRERLDDGDLSLWRQALYWATERQYFTCSHDLKPTTAACASDDGDETLASRAGWRFIGVRKYEEIPGTVKQRSTFCGRPPPGDTTTGDRAVG